MRIEALIEKLPIEPMSGPVDCDVAGLADDSRRVTPGALFVARKGHDSDGHAYVASALQAGAAAVLAERDVSVPSGVTLLWTQNASALLGELAERFYGRPSRKLTLIGITGTNGKTTTAYMVRHLLNAAGRKCGMMTTIEVDDGAETRPADLTTPGAIELSATLATMVDNGYEACVMECSSHALEQGRCDGLDFDVAVFTNLSGDHLDYHNTMEDYAAAKAKLFTRCGTRIVNLDDPWADRICDLKHKGVLGYSLEQSEARLFAQILNSGADGTRLRIDFTDKSCEFTLPLMGRHNVANLLAAVGVSGVDCVGLKSVESAIQSMPSVPGRLERVSAAGAPFTVVVDYAHTDDALRNVLQALRPVTDRRLRVMFGCGGDRDDTKRPRMAKVACALADDIIVTSDNPRTEDPQAIIADILKSVPDGKRDAVTIEVDRRAAIRRAVAGAEPGDVVLLAGKGHETYQIIGSERQPFDDRTEARRALQSMADMA